MWEDKSGRGLASLYKYNHGHVADKDSHSSIERPYTVIQWHNHWVSELSSRRPI